MSRQSSHDPGAHTQRQTSLPIAAALGAVVAADQAAPQQHGSNDRAAQASEEAAIDRKAALKVLQEVEAKCDTVSVLPFAHQPTYTMA